MERGLSPAYFGVSVVSRRDDWQDGEAETLAVLAAHSHDRDGCVLHSAGYGLLCGQRTEPAALARITFARLLDFADAHRSANPH